MGKVPRKGKTDGTVSEFTVIVDVIPGHEEAIRVAASDTPEKEVPRDAAIANIGTIHDARFVLLDNDTRIQFASNFDGEWDTYIDDFATTHIKYMFNEVFQHTVGYPGVGDVEVLKDWFMEHTEEAASYMRAYPRETVKDVLKALAVRDAYEEVLDAPGAEEALKHPALKPLLDLAAA